MGGKMSIGTVEILSLTDAEGMTAVACHFPSPGFGHIVRLEGKRCFLAH